MSLPKSVLAHPLPKPPGRPRKDLVTPVDHLKRPVGRPKNYDKFAVLARLEQKALDAISSGRIRHPLDVMLNYMDALDKAGNLEAAAKFAKELLPYFSSRMGMASPPENNAKNFTPAPVTIVRFDTDGAGETITIGGGDHDGVYQADPWDEIEHDDDEKEEQQITGENGDTVTV